MSLRRHFNLASADPDLRPTYRNERSPVSSPRQQPRCPRVSRAGPPGTFGQISNLPATDSTLISARRLAFERQPPRGRKLRTASVFIISHTSHYTFKVSLSNPTPPLWQPLATDVVIYASLYRPVQRSAETRTEIKSVGGSSDLSFNSRYRHGISLNAKLFDLTVNGERRNSTFLLQLGHIASEIRFTKRDFYFARLVPIHLEILKSIFEFYREKIWNIKRRHYVCSEKCLEQKFNKRHIFNEIFFKNKE